MVAAVVKENFIKQYYLKVWWRNWGNSSRLWLSEPALRNNDYLVRKEQVPDKEYLKEINRKIAALGEKLNKPVVAMGMFT